VVYGFGLPTPIRHKGPSLRLAIFRVPPATVRNVLFFHPPHVFWNLFPLKVTAIDVV
jgi:hypothetical protein